jgi:hypothetical protein
MKNELMMASLLTLTAGAASQAVYPNYAYASNKLSESKLAQEVLMKITTPARYTDSDGAVHDGHLYLRIIQKRETPNFPNQLHAEMQGEFYFESDVEDAKYTVDGVDHTYKTYLAIYGDDGAVLLDKVNADKESGNIYQMYGCSSTSNCETESTYVTIHGENVTVAGKLSTDYAIEILGTVYDPQTQKNVPAWMKDLSDVETTQVPLKKD